MGVKIYSTGIITAAKGRHVICPERKPSAILTELEAVKSLQEETQSIYQRVTAQ